MLGKLLEGRYQVVQVLSSGGFCETYLAQDTHTPGHPTCVVKHLKPASNTPNSLQTLRWLFSGEAQALKKLGNHDQIPLLLDHFEDNQEFYLVQEFVQGHTLSAEMQSGRRWSESQVFKLLQEVLDILQFIHFHGLIHRDIKPNNLLRRKQDNRFVLIDFGSVKQAWSQVITLQGQKINTFAIGLPATITIGTPGYMPTEQERGKPRPNSDIYALGMVCIQALTGLHPTQLVEDPNTCEILWQQYCHVSTDLGEILNKMVRYSFKDRYQSATEVLEALQPLALVYQPTEQAGVSDTDQSAEDFNSFFDQEDTVSFDWSDRTEPLSNDTSDDLLATRARKSVSLLDIGIGVTAVIALLIGIYFALLSPAPIMKIEKYPVSIPLKSN
jgi:serine/threonine-protein kinase